MTHSRSTLLLAFSLPLLAASPAISQDSPLKNFTAIEAYLCTYNEGQTRNDLDKVITRWTKWADSNFKVPYSAWVLSPIFISSNTPVEVVWLGAWQNGIDMGKGLQTWMDKGGDLNAEFDKVVTCSEHSNSASVNLRPPPASWPGKSGIAVFANCTMAEGKTPDEGMAVQQKIAQSRYPDGSDVGVWAFIPGPGNNNPEWDYKLVTSYSDLAAFGASWDGYVNGQGWRSTLQMAQGVISCDSSRVYHSTTVRNAGINPAP
ncbi:hypothetical protein FV139_17455 [Parahaliea maris]|uniref:Uncharacterized protein n=1 Tax=Parahaliea maris TaxID=2716870 RepID=A0A5C8ZQY8_9GAMM|nr:hypothetical protein [Parahaliea maris]TXS90765.1 hypothetical protein FV139_17455 [Parahaliea maris]